MPKFTWKKSEDKQSLLANGGNERESMEFDPIIADGAGQSSRHAAQTPIPIFPRARALTEATSSDEDSEHEQERGAQGSRVGVVRFIVNTAMIGYSPNGLVSTLGRFLFRDNNHANRGRRRP